MDESYIEKLYLLYQIKNDIEFAFSTMDICKNKFQRELVKSIILIMYKKYDLILGDLNNG